MKYEELKKNMIVQIIEDDGFVRNVIVLPVSDKDIKKGIDATHTGLYGFRGLWYKGNGTKHDSYGKIYDLSLYDNIKLVRKDIFGMSKENLKNVLR